MGREVRMVPENWEHPKGSNGRTHQPMFEEYYGDVLNEWIAENKLWEDGTHPDLIDNPKLKEKYPFLAMWDTGAPDVEYYQVKKYKDSEKTHYMMYENTSEGTPISPAFKTPEELAKWLADNKASSFGGNTASYKDWLRMITGIGSSVSRVVTNGIIEDVVTAIP